MFNGAAGAQVSALRTKYATINVSYYKAYVDANEASDGEPFDAQAVYKTLDPMMLAALTEPNVNLLYAAEDVSNQRQHAAPIQLVEHSR